MCLAVGSVSVNIVVDVDSWIEAWTLNGHPIFQCSSQYITVGTFRHLHNLSKFVLIY